MSKKEREIKAKIDWDELNDFWSCQYEDDYGQFFNTRTTSSNRFMKVYKEQLSLIQDIIKDSESYFETQVLKSEMTRKPESSRALKTGDHLAN